jgi:hypothetical protein
MTRKSMKMREGDKYLMDPELLGSGWWSSSQTAHRHSYRWRRPRLSYVWLQDVKHCLTYIDDQYVFVCRQVRR